MTFDSQVRKIFKKSLFNNFFINFFSKNLVLFINPIFFSLWISPNNRVANPCHFFPFNISSKRKPFRSYNPIVLTIIAFTIILPIFASPNSLRLKLNNFSQLLIIFIWFFFPCLFANNYTWEQLLLNSDHSKTQSLSSLTKSTKVSPKRSRDFTSTRLFFQTAASLLSELTVSHYSFYVAISNSLF